MMEKRGILVPYDFKPKAQSALNYACALSPMFRCGVHLLYVIKTGDFLTEMFRSESDINVLKERANDRLREIAAGVKQKYGIETTWQVEKGEPHEVTLNLAREMHTCCIVMGKEGRTMMSHSLLGSSELRVVGAAPCPVYTVPQVSESVSIKGGEKDSVITFKNIILPLDLSKETQLKLKMAIRLAKNYGSSVHVVSVLWGGINVRESRIYERMQRAVAALDEMGIKNTARLYTKPADPIEQVILKHAHTVRGDLLLMLTHQEASTSANYIGAVAQRVIDQADIPVLSLTSLASRDENSLGLGFVDPLKVFKKYHIK